MGPESASLELKWMREELRTRNSAVASSPSFKGNDLERETEELGKMVERRLQGEPLQYILGECGTVIPPGHVFGTSTNCVVVAGDWLSLKQQSPVYTPSSCCLFTPVAVIFIS